MVEVAVARRQYQVVLDDEGGDPQVVGGDRRALAAQLEEQLGVVVGGGFARVEHFYARAAQKAGERLLVLSPSAAAGSDRDGRARFSACSVSAYLSYLQ